MAIIVIKIDRDTDDYAVWDTIDDGIIAAGDRHSVRDAMLEHRRRRPGGWIRPDLFDTPSYIPQHERELLREHAEMRESQYRESSIKLLDAAGEFGSSWPEYVGAWDDETIEILLPQERSIPRAQLRAYVDSGEWQE